MHKTVISNVKKSVGPTMILAVIFVITTLRITKSIYTFQPIETFSIIGSILSLITFTAIAIGGKLLEILLMTFIAVFAFSAICMIIAMGLDLEYLLEVAMVIFLTTAIAAAIMREAYTG